MSQDSQGFAHKSAFLQVSGGATEWYDRPAAEWEEGERLLACGAAAVADLRAAVKAELGFSCSAGKSVCALLLKEAWEPALELLLGFPESHNAWKEMLSLFLAPFDLVLPFLYHKGVSNA